MAARIGQVLRKSLFSQGKTIQKSTLSSVFVRNGSTGNDPPAPPIKPPGNFSLNRFFKMMYTAQKKKF